MRLNFNNIGVGLEAIAGAKRASDLAQESAKYNVTEGAYGPGLQANIQQLQSLRDQDPAQAPAYDQAIEELTRRQGLTAPDYSVASGPTNFATRQEARQASAPLRAEGLAGVYRRYGDVEKADALEARAYEQQRALAREQRDIKTFDTQQAAAAQQGLLTGAQLTDIQRKQNLQAALDARLADINKQEFEKPEMRTQAILGLVEELQGPQAAAQLRANYTQQELNDISLQSKKFDEGYRQSRAKGVFSAMEWFDEQNAAFKLERDPKNPFRVIQVNTDGSRTLFADAKNENELGMIIDAKAKPGGFLELAKYELDVKSKNSLNAYYDAKTKEAKETGGAAANQLSGVQIGYSRDEKGNPIQVMSGLRFNKKTGALESVQVKLEQNVVPATALDPKKINDAAEQLVGTPVDPTNKKGPQHTFQTARQAVTDQIFNQYLGTGVPAGGLDLSPEALAKQILGNQPLSTATPPSAPATPRALTNLGVDPNRAQSNINPVTGQPREAPGSGPNLVAAVTEGLDAGQARYVRYLESKIANNQPLTADEQIRAKRFGLQ